MSVGEAILISWSRIVFSRQSYPIHVIRGTWINGPYAFSIAFSVMIVSIVFLSFFVDVNMPLIYSGR